MKPNKIFDVMDLARRARQMGEIFNPLFVGPPGVGKTEIVQQWCKARNLKSITYTAATLEAPDLRGYPIIETINGRQRMVTAAPDTLPDEGEGVVILEELNRGTTSIMNCIMALTDKRRGFDNYTLPEGWIVVGCINPDNSSDGGALYDTNTMDPALRDRFQMFKVGFDKLSFIQYMKDSKWHKDVVNFVESGVWNYVAPEDVKTNTPGNKYVCPRTLSALNSVLKSGCSKDDELLFFNTVLGDNIGKDFYQFLNNESPVFYFDLKNNLKQSLKKLEKFSDPNNFKNGMISLTINDILEHNEIDDKLLVEVVKVIPVDQSKVLIMELEFKRDDKEILKRLTKNFSEVKELFKSIVNYNKKTS